MSENKKKLAIIDGNAIIHRSYHAIPPLTTKDGKMVNAVYGFASMTLKVLKDLRPEYIAITFDMAGPTFRHKKFKEYKATRVKADQELYDQIPLVHELVDAFGFSIYEQSGFEADDVIGTIAKQVGSKDVEVYIVTGDMDALQLVDDNIKVYTLRKGINDIVIYDEEKVKERMGFGPELVVDYKAFRGDPSDNIPGVSGIGEKTATNLIVKYGDLENIYKEVKKKDTILKGAMLKRLLEGEESAKMSYELAQIDCHVPNVNFKLEDAKIKKFDEDKILDIFQKFEFVSLLKRIPGFSKTPLSSPLTKGRKQRGLKKTNFKFVENFNLETLEKDINKNKSFACEATQNNFIFVVSGSGYFVENNSKNLKFLKNIFTNKNLEIVGHDLKSLLKNINKNLGVSISDINNKLFDTMVASYLLNPGSRSHDKAGVIFKILGKEITGANGQESLFGIDNKTKAQELFFVSQTAEKLKQELEEISDAGLLEKMEMPLLKVLAQMELNGIKIDTKKLKELSDKALKISDKLTKKIFDLAGEEFNIASPVQLREILFEKLEIPTQGIKKGKTGLSTASAELDKMRDLHPIIKHIEDYREITKLQNTYIDVLPKLIDEITGRVHSTFNQTVTATGRLSSSDPNLQNIPIRTELGREIRDAFIAERGYKLIGADYSQIELRIVASLAKDKKMLEIFESGQDIHSATAAIVHNVPLEKVGKDMRRSAKEVNFGVLYGMGVYGLSSRTGMSNWKAKEFIEKYFEEFSGVKKYLDETLEFAKENGFCETLFGRRRYVPELKSSNFQLRSAGERMAVNHPIQGTAADLMKLAMIEVSEKLQDSLFLSPLKGGEKHAPPFKEGVGGGQGVKLVLQVHDELIFEVKEGLVSEVSKIVKETMENVVKLNVPVEVEVESGNNWGEIH